MLNVYTNDQFDNLIEIGSVETEEDAWAIVTAYLHDRGIYPYYYRMWKQLDGTNVIDYGSHTEFIYYDEK